VLVQRNVDACYSSHCILPLELTLTLLMTRVGANHAHHTIAANDLAVPTHFSD
jgi:hypothetical protein